MTNATVDRRRALTAIVVLAVLPLLTGMLLVRPAQGQESQFSLYTITAEGGPVVLGGDIGAGGGLTMVDGGSPFGAVRLDASPSSSAKAAAVEPGTLFRTVVGVANTEAGEQVVEVPTAEASYPGDQQESDGDALGSNEDAGGRNAGATAHVEAHEFDALVRAEGGASDYGVMVQEGSTLDITASVNPATGVLTSTVVSRSGRSSFGGGAFVMDSVVGTVVTSVTPAGRVVEATTVASGAEVGGVPVRITDEGVIADGTVIVPGQPGRDAQDVVNEILQNGGITVEAIAPREEVDGAALLGDSGGVRVTVVTAGTSLAPGNTLVMTFGKALATSFDEPPRAPLPDVTVVAPAQAPPAGQSPPTASSSTPGLSGSAPSQVTSAPVAPEVAGPRPEPVAAASVGGEMVLAGHRVPTRMLLAAFGGWQLLSLSICTMAVFALRRDPAKAAF